jgi:hypothetical protein
MRSTASRLAAGVTNFLPKDPSGRRSDIVSANSLFSLAFSSSSARNRFAFGDVDISAERSMAQETRS